MQNKIFELLKNEKNYISGQEISELLGISRQAVWKYINSLKEKGFEIASVPNRGYKLVALPQNLCREAADYFLTTKILGRSLTVLESVDSTNNYLKNIGGTAPDGAAAAAREQVAGKGRLGRTWLSAKDQNLMFSFLAKPRLTPMEVSGITPLAGLAVCKALRAFCGADCKIKWPNDIIIGNKKLAGILTEMSAEFDAVEYIVTGIGINVDQEIFPEEIQHKVTSLYLETGKHFNLNELLAQVLKSLEETLYGGDFRLSYDAAEEYKKLCATIGREVSFPRGRRTVSGMAVGITSGGELEVMLSDGSLCNVNSGEVTVQGIY